MSPPKITNPILVILYHNDLDEIPGTDFKRTIINIVKNYSKKTILLFKRIQANA